MSVTGHYWRLTSEEWSRLEPYLNASRGTAHWREGEQAFVDLISPEWMETDRYLDLEKEWHLLHALLTGRWEDPSKMTPVPPPLGNAIRGGTETPYDAHDGMTRYLLPAEVQDVAHALAQISVEQLCERVDIDLVRHSGIYAWFPDSKIESVYYFINYYYPRLDDFFALAARDENIVLLSLD